MADNVTFTSGAPADFTASTEEVTNLNGGTVAAQHAQRVLAAVRTADSTVIDLPATSADGLLVNLGSNNDVVVTGSVAATQSGVWTVGVSGTIATSDGGGSITVDDGGGSVTIDGTVAATQSGSWTVGVTGTVPLPTGAATAAKQPALGTAGTASADVLTVQGIASMTALKVDGSAVTQPISATSLPLPAGAATAAKQPAIGTAGTPAADVITVQGAASMTPLKVDASATTQPVSAATLPLPTGAATAAKQDALAAQLPATIGQKTGAGSVSVVLASDQSAVPVSQSGTWTVQPGNNANTTPWLVRLFRSPNSSISTVAASVTSTTLLAANTGRLIATIYNDSTTASLFIKLGATASTSSFTVKLGPGDYYEMPINYSGVIDGIWDAAVGNARITEVS